MKDKKAAKILIKRAKANPDFYTDTEVKYARLIKRTLKLSNNEQPISLKINQNKDGSFTVEWDKQDPEWSWMNNLTSKEIQGIMEKAIHLDKNK